MAGLIDLGINYKRQANAGFGEVSKARTEQALFNRKMNAQNKAGAYNAAGTGLGLGYMAYQNGMLGKAAETLNASPEVVKALTPTPEAPPPGSIGGNPAPPPPTEPVVPVEPTPVAVPEVAAPEVAGGGEAAAAGGEAAAAGEGIGTVASNLWASFLALL